MNLDLNATIGLWLQAGGPRLLEKIAEEIDNRFDCYPALYDVLQQRPIDLVELADQAENCWVVEHHTFNRLKVFLSNEGYAQNCISRLIDMLPEHPDAIADHIDTFIEDAVAGGFVDEKGYRDLAGAAAVASVLLTTQYPETFVDYPSKRRWERFVQSLGYALPSFESHGQRIVWMSEFAQEVAAQPVFERTWPGLEPLWVVSGLCWASGRKDEESPAPPDSPAVFAEGRDPIPDEFKGLSLAELRRRAVEKASFRATPQERKANYYNRSNAIKAYALARARGVCEGCGELAPFEKPSGDPFLEVHHIERLADGGPDAPDAVAALCPNCHRRAHHAHDAAAFNAALAGRIGDLERGDDADH